MADLAILAKLEDNASKGLAALDGQLRGLEGSAGVASKGFAGLQQAGGMIAIGAIAAVGAAGAAVTKFGIDSSKAFMDFQGGMNEVFTLMPGMTADAMSKMQDDLLAFDNSMGRTSDETIPALYQAISAGVPADNVFSFMETAHQAAVGGVTDLQTAVDGISSVVNAYGADMMSATQASDLMFTAVRLGKTDFSQLSASLFQVTPTAAALGVQFGDVTAALAALTAQGVPTSVATTQMRQMFVELSKEGGKTSATFQELSGQSFKDFIASGGNVADALQLLEDYAKETGVGVNDLFGSVEAGAAALSLTGAGMETFRANIAAMAESAGASQAAYDQMQTSLSRAFDLMRAQFETFKIQTGAALAPVVEFMTVKFNEISSVVMPKVSAALETVGTVLGSFFNNLEEGMGPVDSFIEAIWDFVPKETALALADLRDTVGGFIDKAKEALQPIIDFLTRNVELKDVLLGLGIAVATVVLPIIGTLIGFIAGILAPVLLVIAAVAALRIAWENDFLGIRTAAEGAFEFLKGAFESVKGAIDTFKEGMDKGLEPIDALKGALEELGINAGPVLDGIQAGVDALKEAFENIKGAIDTFKTGMADGLAPIDALKLALEELGINAGPVLDGIVTAAEGAFEFLQGAFESVKTAIDTFKTAMADGLDPVDALREAIGTFGEDAQNVFDSVMEAVGKLTDFFAPTIERIQEAFAGLGDSMSENSDVIDGLKEAFDRIVPILETVGGIIGGALVLAVKVLMEAFGQLIENAGQIFGGLVETITGALNTISSIVEGVINIVKAAIEGDWTGAWEAFKETASGVIEGVTTIISGLGEIVDGVFGAIWDTISNLVTDLGGTAVTWDEFKTNISTAFEDAKTAVTTALTDALAAVTGFVTDITQAGRDIINGLIGGIEEKKEAVKTKITEIIGGIPDAVKKLLGIESPSKVFAAIGSFIMDGLAVGIVEGADGPVAAIRTAVGDIKLTAMNEIAEMVVNVTSAIHPAIAALNQLANFSVDPRVGENTSQFMFYLRHLVASVVVMAFELDGARNKTLKMAEIINEVVGSVGSGITSFNQLARMAFPASLLGNIDQFAGAVGALTLQFAGIADQLETELIVKAQALADMTGYLFGVISVVLDGSRALANMDFAAVVSGPYGTLANQIVVFRNIVRTLVREFAEAALELGGFADFVSAFGEAASKVVDLVADGLEAAKALADTDFDALVNGPYNHLATQIVTFRNIIRTLVREFAGAASDFSEELMDSVSAFADAAGDIVGLVADALAATTLLAEFDFVTAVGGMTLANNILIFRNIVNTLVARFAEVAAGFTDALSSQVQSFADAAEAVLDLIEPGIEAVRILANESIPSLAEAGAGTDTTLIRLSDWISLIAQQFSMIAQSMGEAMFTNVKAFTDAALVSISLIEPGISAVRTLATETIPAVAEAGAGTDTTLIRLSDWVSLIAQQFSMIAQDLSEEAATAINQFATAAEASIGLIEPGIAAVRTLATETIPAVADASAGTDTTLIRLSDWVNLIAQQFSMIAQNINEEAAAAINRFAEAAGSILDLIGSAIDGLIAIADYAPAEDLDQRLHDFITVLGKTVWSFGIELTQIAHDLGERIEIARTAANAVAEIFGFVKPTVDGLRAIAEYAPAKDLDKRLHDFITILGKTVWSLGIELTQIAHDLGERVAIAVQMSKSINDILAQIIITLESLQTIAQANTPDTKAKMTYLVEQANLIATTLSGANQTVNGTIIAAAKAFAAAVNEVVSEVIEALASLNRLVTANTPGGLQAILDAMRAALSNQIGPAGIIGREIGDAFATGLMAEMQSLLNQLSGVMNALLAILRSGIGPAGQAGTDLGRMFAQALSAQQGLAAQAGALVGNAAADGMKNALKGQAANIANAARDMAKAAADSARKELQIASPSKVFAKIGEQAGQGFTLGLPTINAAAYAGAGASSATTNNVRQGDSISIHISVGGNVSASTLRDVETAVQRGLNSAGRSAESRRRR